MAQDKPVNTDNYAGAGKFFSATGGFFMGSAIGGAVLAGAFGKSIVQSGGLSARQTLIGRVFMAASTITGAIIGWRQAAKGEEQFEAMKSQADVKDGLITGLETQISGLHQEAQAHRASFAERQAKKEPMGFHIPKEHGSHADAVRTSQNEAEQSERAV